MSRISTPVFWTAFTTLLMLLLAGSAAEAAFYPKTLCFRWQPSFADNGSEDWLSSNQIIRAWGVSVQVRDNSNNIVLYDGYSRDNGCISLLLDTNRTYRVRMRSEALVKRSSSRATTGQVVRYRFRSSDTPRTRTIMSAYRPPAGSGTSTFTWAPGLSSETSSVMAAASYTVRYASGNGLGANTWALVNDFCPSGGNVACYSPDDFFNTGTIYLKQASTDLRRKFTIAHELGHHLMNLYGNLVPDLNYDITQSAVGRCASSSEGHGLNSLEYQSSAATEGFANFVAAVAWNSESQNDCRYRTADCELGTKRAERVCFTHATIANFYLPQPGHGVEMDWTRTLWDLTTDSDVPVTNIYRLMSSLGGNRFSTYSSALDRANALGVSSFGYRARFNGIDW